MNIIGIFGHGVRETIRVWRAVIILWFANVIFALLAVLPLAFLIDNELGHSFLGNRVRGFDFLWLGEAVYKFRNLPPVMAGWFLGVAGLFFITSVFLTGGVVGRLVERALVRPAGFFGDCGHFFWRFIRLFLLSLPIYLIFLGLFSRVLSAALKPVSSSAATEWTPLIVSWLEFLVVLLVFSIFQMLFDYTKVRLAADDSRQVLRSFGRTVGFVLGNFRQTWGTYLLVSVFFFLGFVAFHKVLNLLPGYGLVPAILGFLLTQGFVLFRLWTRVQYFATAFVVDRDRRR